jgi:hypothetical protein
MGPDNVAKARRPEFLYRALFRPDQIGALEKLDKGFDEQGCGFGYTQAYHKAPIDSIPYRIPSEYIAAKIGELIGLPVPPCAITRFGPDNTKLFSSLDFNFERASLVPIFEDVVASKMPLVCAGILVFDIFIGNEDRHDENVVVDRGNDPREIHIFDHDHALLSGMTFFGKEKIDKLYNDIGITGKPPINNNRHVFLDQLKSREDLDFWIGRIGSIPDFFLENVCSFAEVEIGLERSVADYLATFLKWRKTAMRGLIKQQFDEFTSMPKPTGPKTLFD